MKNSKKKSVRKLNYLKAVVIVHGKSELQMCEFIKSNLRIKIEIHSEKKGGKSIQITSIIRYLNNEKFETINKFNLYHDFVKQDEDTNEISSDFKIFIIMDTDDCTKQQKEAFVKKTMFKNHWACEYIIPIYNTPELESVLKRAEILIENKRDYIKIFPTDKKYIKSDMIQVQELSQRLKKNKDTNLYEFLDFCLSLAE